MRLFAWACLGFAFVLGCPSCLVSGTRVGGSVCVFEFGSWLEALDCAWNPSGCLHCVKSPVGYSVALYCLFVSVRLRASVSARFTCRLGVVLSTWSGRL